jgi:hypothetical protein
MPRVTEEDRVKHWVSRIDTANKKYEAWRKKFRTDILEDYYLGDQWQHLSEDERKDRYCINLVYSTIEVNKPSLSFFNPQVKVEPRAARGSTLGSKSNEKARLCGDTIQTFIDDRDVGFMPETALALHEAHFRFGIVEVGYTADWIDNPNKGKPVLKSRADGEEVTEDAKAEPEKPPEPQLDSEGNPVMEPDRKITSENLYVMRIPASSYRVSGSSLRNRLDQNEWVGYYTWHRVEDVKANTSYKNLAKLKPTGEDRNAPRAEEELPKIDDELASHEGMVKLWKIWDLRAKKRIVLAEGHDKFLMDGEPFKFLPHAVMKFHEQLDNFYPMPPVYQWISPQDEFNETRESQRAHRRRFYRRYTMMKGAMEQSELDKLEDGGDGVVAESNVPEPIQVVPDAAMGADVWNHLGETKQDFMSVSGVGMDQRGVADSETATQATIIDARTKIRESSARTRVGDWLAEIARLILLTVREKMALPFWIQRNVDMAAVMQVDPLTGLPNIAPVQQVADLWTEITSGDIDDLDLDVSVDLASLSPVTEAEFRNSWNQVLALLTNPALLQVLAMSPALLRRTLLLYGIRQENDIQEITQVVQQMMMMAQQAAQQAQLGEAMDEADKAGVDKSLIEEAGRSGAGGPLIPPEVQSAIESGGMVQ